MKTFTALTVMLATASALAVSAPAAMAQTVTERADTGGLADIVVTARKQEENLQDVPIAISAFTGDSLAASRVSGVQDLNVTIPGLHIPSAGVGQTPFLRGVGSSDTAPGQESAVAIYVDGVYQPMPWSNMIPFNNIERVEVLKGPQGTLFGRNATGGLIHVVTRDPSGDLQGNASVAYERFDRIIGKGYIGGDIAEGIAADFAAYYSNQRDGWGKNLITGNDVFKGRSYALRSKWVFQPSDRAKITVIGDYRKERSSNNYTFRVVPGTISIGGDLPTENFYNIRADMDPLHRGRVWSASGKVEYDFDAFTLTSLSAYQDNKFKVEWDNDGSVGETLVHVSVDKAITRMFTQELQLASNSNGPFRWIAGLYYMNMVGGWDGPKGIQLYGEHVVPSGGAPFLGVDIISKVKTKSYAVFAEVTYDVTPSTHLTVGGRFTRDERRLYGEQFLEGGAPGLAPIMSLGAFDLDTSFEEPTYRAMLSQDVADGVMLYASYSRGFKSGNFNTTNPANPPFQPEKLDAYEVGFKSRLIGNALQLNAAAFYYDYANMQLFEARGPTTNVVNAASSKIKGFEIDATARPTDRLSARMGFTYLDSEYTDFENAACFFSNPAGGNTAMPCDVSGNPLVRSPKFTVNLGADYTLPTSVGDFTLTTSYYFNSGFNFSPEGKLHQADYNLLNAQLRWTSLSERYNVTLYASNITKQKYTAFQVAQGEGDVQVAGAPRVFGVEFGVRF